MNILDKKLIVISVLIAILFVSAITGTIFHYNGVVNSENFKIASLNNQISNFNIDITNLNNELENLTSQNSNIKSPPANSTSQTTQVFYENLTSDLSMSDTLDPLQIDSTTESYLFTNGSVTNSEPETVYNAGLQVDAYNANGSSLIDLTVPLGNATYEVGLNVFGSGEVTSSQVVTLHSEQNVTVDIGIFYAGIANNWTATPVWTNSP